MPFHKYSPKTAKSLFKATPPPPSQPRSTSSPSANARNNDGKPMPATESLKKRLDRTRALITGIQKERYKSDLERSRMGLKEAAKARIEAAQRAALDDGLRNEALEELRKQQLPSVMQKLEEELRPKVHENLLVELRAELQPKVHAELRTELVEELTEKVWTELQESLHDEVEENLRLELEETLADSVRDKLYHDLYPEVVAQLKDEYRDMVLLQLKEEVANELAKDPIVNGRFEDALDPALMAESEASDIGQAPSELAVLAKRRFSEGFEDEDPETRSKKLKMLNEDEELPDAQASSLAPGNHSLRLNSGAGQVNESLDEGEKADVEDEPGNPLASETADKPAEQAATKTTRGATPEDVNADGGDELSDEELEGNNRQHDQDADAVMEPEVDDMSGICATPRPGSSQEAQLVKYPQIPTPDSPLRNGDKTNRSPQPDNLAQTTKASRNDDIIINGTASNAIQEGNSLSSSRGNSNAASQSSSPRIPSWVTVGTIKQNLFSNKTLPTTPGSTGKATPRPYPHTSQSSPSNKESEHEDEDEDEDEDEEESDGHDTDPAIYQEDSGLDEMADEESEMEEEDDDIEPIDEDAVASDEEDEEAGQSEEEEEEDDEMDDEENSNASDAPSNSHLEPVRLHSQFASLPSFASYSQGGHQDDPIALDSD